MNTTSRSDCPFHASAGASSPPPHASGAWPPGPRAGLTGWSLLHRMSGDLLGTLAQWQREFGDLVHLRIWPEHEIVITDPQLVRELLVEHHDALIRWERGMRVMAGVQGTGVFVAEGQAWRDKRQALHPSFSGKAVQAFVPTIAAAAERALARWPTDDSGWPVEGALTSLAMDVIMRMMFSSDIGEDARVAEQAVRTVVVAANKEFYWPASWPDWMPWKRAKRRAIMALKGLIERHLQARLTLAHEAWPDDLLTRLLTLHREDAKAWPLQAVRHECMTAFLAGHETTAATLTWWMWCMAAHPQAQSVAAEEVSRVLGSRAPTADALPALRYLTQTVQETLRLYPAAPLLNTRRSTRRIALGPWEFPAGTLFMLPVQLMHHDARWFPDPLAYAPERFGPGASEFPRGAFLPFGAGQRVCLGQHLAMTELTVIAALILQRFALAVPQGEPTPTPLLNVSLRPQKALHLRVLPRPGRVRAA